MLKCSDVLKTYPFHVFKNVSIIEQVFARLSQHV